MKTNKTRRWNLYSGVHKNKKRIASIISILIVISLLFGLFSQLLFMYHNY